MGGVRGVAGPARLRRSHAGIPSARSSHLMSGTHVAGRCRRAAQQRRRAETATGVRKPFAGVPSRLGSGESADVTGAAAALLRAVGAQPLRPCWERSVAARRGWGPPARGVWGDGLRRSPQRLPSYLLGRQTVNSAASAAPMKTRVNGAKRVNPKPERSERRKLASKGSFSFRSEILTPVIARSTRSIRR